jgi:hypothetical protein
VRIGDEIAGFTGITVIGNAEALALAAASGENRKVDANLRRARMALAAQAERRALEAWFAEEEDRSEETDG